MKVPARLPHGDVVAVPFEAPWQAACPTRAGGRRRADTTVHDPEGTASSLPRSLVPASIPLGGPRSLGRVLAALTVTATIGVLMCPRPVFAEPNGSRSVAATAAPGTGATVGSPASGPRSPTRPPATAAGSLSGKPDEANCAELRRRYARSQACFSRFRLKNGGLKPEAFRHCRQITNPSVKCGSEVVR